MRNSLLSNSRTAFIAIIIVYIWQYAGYIMLIYITGLSTVPKDVLEAASIDGANAMTTLFKIKIPMIASTITICTLLDADIRLQAVRCQHGVDERYRFREVHGKDAFQRNPDACSEHL